MGGCPVVEVVADRASLARHKRYVRTRCHTLTATMSRMRPATSLVLVVLLALIMGAFVINIFMRGLV